MTKEKKGRHFELWKERMQNKGKIIGKLTFEHALHTLVWNNDVTRNPEQWTTVKMQHVHVMAIKSTQWPLSIETSIYLLPLTSLYLSISINVISLSLSLSIYIYIYVYSNTGQWVKSLSKNL